MIRHTCCSRMMMAASMALGMMMVIMTKSGGSSVIVDAAATSTTTPSSATTKHQGIMIHSWPEFENTVLQNDQELWLVHFCDILNASHKCWHLGIKYNQLATIFHGMMNMAFVDYSDAAEIMEQYPVIEEEANNPATYMFWDEKTQPQKLETSASLPKLQAELTKLVHRRATNVGMHRKQSFLPHPMTEEQTWCPGPAEVTLIESREQFNKTILQSDKLWRVQYCNKSSKGCDAVAEQSNQMAAAYKGIIQMAVVIVQHRSDYFNDGESSAMIRWYLDDKTQPIVTTPPATRPVFSEMERMLSQVLEGRAEDVGLLPKQQNTKKNIAANKMPRIYTSFGSHNKNNKTTTMHFHHQESPSQRLQSACFFQYHNHTQMGLRENCLVYSRNQQDDNVTRLYATNNRIQTKTFTMVYNGSLPSFMTSFSSSSSRQHHQRNRI